MRTHLSDDDLSGEETDWLEAQFFAQAALRPPDLDWGPIAPMAPSARRAMHATLGMVAIAFVGWVAFTIYSNVIMPLPAPLGSAEPVLPPTAADTAAPNG